jgi:hypothetical protein
MRKYFRTFDHTCELAEEDTSSSVAWRRKLLEWTTIDPTNQLTRHDFNSYSRMVNERKFHLASHPLTVHPFSRLKSAWEAFMLGVFLCGLIYAPLLFLDYVDKHNTNESGSLAIMRLVKFFCIVDMIARLFTGYIDERSKTVSNR